MAQTRLLTILLGLFGLYGLSNGAVMDIYNLVSQYEDEILSRGLGLPIPEKTPQVEEQEYKNTGDVGHPVEVHKWDSNLKLGQVSAVSTNLDDDPVVFHRGSIEWQGDTFDASGRLTNRQVIPEDAIVTVDQDSGKIKSSMGGNIFYMPHGLTIDHLGNTWVTDVGLHQVMMFPKGSKTPALTLGTKFEPGNDKDHFCKPTAVAVSKSGQVFVADGYCNNRVAVFDTTGRYLREMKGNWTIVHSLALFEDEDVLCVADREGGRVVCAGAGIERPQLSGAKFLDVPGLGRVYGIAGRGSALLVVSIPRELSATPSGLTLDLTQDGRIVDTWGNGKVGSSEEALSNPHQVAISKLRGDTVYVAEIGPNRIRKFEVVTPEDDIF